jgi:hypothetical protein
LELQNSKTKNTQNSQEQNSAPPPPPPPPPPRTTFTPKKENGDPQNDPKKNENPQFLKKQKNPLKFTKYFFSFETKITIKTNGQNHHMEDKRED